MLIDRAYTSPFAPFPEVLAAPTTRDYTQVPSYELPSIRTAKKINDVQGFTALIVARRNVQ